MEQTHISALRLKLYPGPIVPLLCLLLLVSCKPSTSTPIPGHQLTLEQLQRLARRDSAAQYELAVVYRLGKTGETNLQLAAKYFEKAARAGHADAQFRIGHTYSSGIGVPVDYKKAHSWLSKAVKQQQPQALCELSPPTFLPP